MAGSLAALAPPGVRTGCRAIHPDDLAALHAVELDAVAGAVPKRRHEFASGRVLLRQLLGSDVAVPVRANRAPALPVGVVGSLAHDAALAVAAVADAGAVQALGVDVEPATTLGDEMARVILRADEDALDAHLAFTLKEAVYKAWSAGGGRILDHHEVRVTLDAEGDGFVGVEVDSGAVYPGRWTRIAGRWLALVVVAAPRPGALTRR